MDSIISEDMISFVKNVLLDDHGMSQETFDKLESLAAHMPVLANILSQVETLDGRFFLPEE